MDAYSPQTIKFLSLSLKAYIQTQDQPKINETYRRAVDLILYNFGTYHPLHSNFSSFLAFYYIQIQKFEVALQYQ